ncbi:RNA metabolism protein [Lithospermum erythrorhizon]|uniref:RNA metabolism protein n=1 Tax=Lithospermum erythrorhizon TaxID=34254 RepID=A0AAV3R2Q7_LITER
MHQICSLLHQRYTDFSPSLVQGLVKLFFPGKSSEDADADRNSRALKKRSTLKLLLELYFVGVVDDSGIFVSIIKDLTSVEHLKDRETTQTNLSLLASFARQGRFLLGLPLNGQDILEEFFKGLNITVDQKKLFRKALQAYYDSVTETLQSEHASLRQLEHENAKILNSKGELNEENAASYEKLRKSFYNLYRGVTVLAEALDVLPPVMPEDGHTTRVTSGEDASSPNSGRNSSNLEALWDDDDTKAFYEGLPDLRAFVPAVLLGEAESKSNEQSSKSQEQQIDSAPETEQSTTQESVAISAQSGCMQEDKNLKGKEKDEKDKDGSKEVQKEKVKEKDPDRKSHDKEKLKSVEGSSLDSLFQRLPNCVSRDLIDQLTVEFCYLNSKSNRKKLVRILFNVPRTSLELLPYYSRIIATLSTCMKDVSSMILQLLEEEFNFLTSKKDQMNIETKIRNIRFLGELCKFKIAPPGLIFSCLKTCLDDFSHHNIDVACNLLETCGRYLYRSPDTNVRMANMLEILMRLKKVKNLDPRHSTLVENAYYLCKPPERSARVSKVRPPLYQYIRKLLFSDLDKSSIEHVLRQLRKLPWGECESYLLKCFLKVHKGKYSQIHLLASLTAGLSRYHDEFVVAVVDEVLEEIRLGLEFNEYGMQQRRIAHMRFLGELYNYELVDSSLIFDTLNLILVFGHGTSEQDTLDPPEDYFRVRMVITLLETCGHYFDRGSSKRKLDRFLIHFQRYTLCKGVLPLDIEFDLQDLFAVLRPNMTRYSAIEDVDAALIKIEEHERSVSSDKANSDKYSDTEKSLLVTTSSNTSLNGQSLENGIEQNGDLHEDQAVESESDSGSGTSEQVGHDDEGESYEENPDDDSVSQSDSDDGGGPGSDEDDEVHVRQKVAEVDPLEAADFDRELRALMQESLDSRKLELRARPTLNMMIPMNLFEGSTKDHHGRGIEFESGDDTMDEGGGGSKDVPVKVLVKRGNKQQTRHMYIPRDCSLVQSTKEKGAAELEEKQDIKRLVLEYNDREEEDFNGLIQQQGGWANSTANRVFHRGGHTWDHGRSSGSRHRQHHHSSGGTYYGRRR